MIKAKGSETKTGWNGRRKKARHRPRVEKWGKNGGGEKRRKSFDGTH